MSKTHAFRILPGKDLRKEIAFFVEGHQIQAGWIASAVGSLTDYNIRFANQPEGKKDSGHFEIVSLVGTVSIHGSHMHISISDDAGRTIGGHLLNENIIYTTAEIIIQESERLIFHREQDGNTNSNELIVKKKS
jgi:predicted DNA-binding protein with PD1-like motif